MTQSADKKLSAVSAPVSAKDAMRLASELVPVFRERAARTEELRQLPEESVEDLLCSGLIRLGLPVRHGGVDLDYRLGLRVAAELARGCPSTSWCYSLWTGHAWLMGFWPLAAQEEVYGSDPDTLVASSLIFPKADCVPVEGGYRVAGRWEFSSGCDASGWIMLGLPGVGQRSWGLVPRDDFEIVDNWFVSGLKGSGSKDIVLGDAFIPHHRVLEVTTAGSSDLSAWELHGQHRYRVPLPVLLGWDLLAPMLGITQGMIDEFTARLEGTSGPGRTADSPAIHVRLSQAAAELDAARALLEGDIVEILRKGEAGESFTLLERARFKRDKALTTQLCLQAVNRLFDVSGGHALFDSVPLQRFHRDAQAVAHRDLFIMDMGGQDYGRVLLGLPPLGPV